MLICMYAFEKQRLSGKDTELPSTVPLHESEMADPEAGWTVTQEHNPNVLHVWQGPNY